jgi:2-oxoglutarate ferredoxin oxidoreductase subunit beta
MTSQIIQAAFEMNLEPHQAAKLSGIGCSSRTPACFLNRTMGVFMLARRMVG